MLSLRRHAEKLYEIDDVEHQMSRHGDGDRPVDLLGWIAVSTTNFFLGLE
jgi:hypothetical protein